MNGQEILNTPREKGNTALWNKRSQTKKVKLKKCHWAHKHAILAYIHQEQRNALECMPAK